MARSRGRPGREGSIAIRPQDPAGEAAYTAAGPGAPAAIDALWLELQSELRRLARRRVRAERDSNIVSTTDLLHDVYIKLNAQRNVPWTSRGQFLALAAQAMRRLLIDNARRHRRLRRVRYDSADAERSEAGNGVDPAVRLAATQRSDELLALDEALERLGRVEPRLVQVVECRFFGGYTETETAEALGVTTRTVTRDWARARVWLRCQLSDVVES